MSIDVKRLIKSREKKEIKTQCEGCGQEIKSDDDPKDVEYVKTKRGTEVFFHQRCMGKIWRK